MSTLMPLRLKICRFDIDIPTLKYYLCYKNEICCEKGCCTSKVIKNNNNDSYELFKSWYFWLAIFLLFVIYRCLIWYYRQYKQQLNQQNNNELQNGQLFDNTSYNRQNHRQLDIEKSLNQHNSDDDDGPPPVYSVAVNYPKPTDLINNNNNNNNNTDNSDNNDDNIPNYEQAVSKQI